MTFTIFSCIDLVLNCPLFLFGDLVESQKVSQLYVLRVVWKFTVDHCLILSFPFLFAYKLEL